MFTEERVARMIEAEWYSEGIARAHAHAHKNDGVFITDSRGVTREKRSSTGEAGKLPEWFTRALYYINGVEESDVKARAVGAPDGFIKIEGKRYSYEFKTGSGSVKYAKSAWTPFTEADLTVEDIYPTREYILYNPDAYSILKEVDYTPSAETILRLLKTTKVLTRAQFLEVASAIGLKFGNSTRLMINLKTVGKKNRRVFDSMRAPSVYDLVEERYLEREGRA